MHSLNTDGIHRYQRFLKNSGTRTSTSTDTTITMTTTTSSTVTTVPQAAPLRTLSEFPQPIYGALVKKQLETKGIKEKSDMIWYDSGIDFTKLCAVLAVFGSITLSYTGFNLWSDLVEARWVDWNRHRHFARLCGFEFSIRDVREARASVSRSLPTPKEQGFIKLVIFCWFRCK